MSSMGHLSEYVYGKEAPQITITNKSNDTVMINKGFLEGSVDIKSEVILSVNDSIVETTNENFQFEFPLYPGRNKVELIVESEDGRTTRKPFNFVYMTGYDIIVDADYLGIEGELMDGVPVYKTVAGAIQKADNNGTVIFIKNGRYHEKLTIDKRNLFLIGEDNQKTVLHYDVASGSKDSNGNEYGTSGSASLTLNSSASGFSAENLTISNEFDYVGKVKEGFQNTQAVALLNMSEGSVFTNVSMLGYQDTLYAHSNRQYYNKCYITGNVDYIFGGAKAFFEDCDMVNRLPGYVTAASTEGASEFGFVINNCRILGEPYLSNNTVYLARPWRQDAFVVYINNYMEQVVRSVGYCDMSGNDYRKARFAEYGSYGPGYAVNSDRIQLSKEEADGFKKEAIFEDFDVNNRSLEISNAYLRNNGNGI